MKKLVQIALLVFFLTGIFSCKKDRLTTDSSAKLTFSTNSILFDTVFTTVGSTTKSFIVYNHNSNAINISSIKLGAGNNSQFFINVDGAPVKSTTNVVIPGKDSLFVFVKVTVNPTGSNSPLVIRDSVIFTTNGNVQSVLLEAWGQDAYYHYPTNVQVLPDGSGIYYDSLSCNSIWTNDKPHVIYNYAIVESGCTLTMQPGTSVYLHNGAVLYVNQGGTLKIQGSQASPVTFQGDRLEAEYKDIPGQWGQILLSPGSKNNRIDWAVIKNGIIGVESDTVAGPNDSLVISNTIIKNMTGAAIYGKGAHMYGYNCVFANCQQYCGGFIYGGNYHFYQCTFADYWSGNSATRTTPTLLINNWYQATTGATIERDITSAYFGNCIIYGNLTNEIGLDSSITVPGKFNYKFQNCVILADGSYNALNTYHNDSVIKNADPLFTNPAINDYTIGAGSSAINKGNILIGNMFPIDLNGKSRIVGGKTDIGAYEH